MVERGKIVNRGIVYDGVPSKEELASCPGVPSEERMRQGRVAVIECVQEIPCNPCSFSCKFNAITIIDKSYSDKEVVIDFPFEYLPLPQEHQVVDAVNRYGEVVCKGIIKKVKQVKAYAGTTVVSMIIPIEFADEVRSMKRLAR